MTTHDLKCTETFWDAVASGKKPFELRLNDRDYQVGDILLLRRYIRDGHYDAVHWIATLPAGWVDPNGRTHIGGTKIADQARTLKCEVTYLLDSYEGLKPGYVALGIKILEIVQ
jgi:hypothetical protein